MPKRPKKIPEHGLRVTRLQIRTIAAMDPARAMSNASAARYLRARAKSSWLRIASTKLTGDLGIHGNAAVVESAYAGVFEFGRPTFSESFLATFMPIQVSRDPVGGEVGLFRWTKSALKLGSTGALTLSYDAELSTHTQSAGVSDVIDSFHEFRRAIAVELAEDVASTALMWNEVFPEYRLDPEGLGRLRRSAQFYDVVDFDYLIDETYVPPKHILAASNLAAIKEIAGITRMSKVSSAYSEQSARRLFEFDLGNRPDEMWFVNPERLTRHHAEHLTDPAKRHFFSDVVLGVELVMQEKAAITYLTDRITAMRSDFVEKLLTEDEVHGAHESMEALLGQIAWASEITEQTLALEYDEGTSFFRLMLDRLFQSQQILLTRNSLLSNIDRLLNVAQAVFSERVSRGTWAVQDVGLKVARSSRNAAIGAVVLAIASTTLVVVQLVLSAAAPSPQPSLPGPPTPQLSWRPPSPSPDISTVVPSPSPSAPTPGQPLINE